MCGSKARIMRKLIIYMAASLALLSCVKERRDTLSGTGEKTPLQVGLALQAGGGSVATKAADMAFDEGDKFVAYLRHVTWDGQTSGARTNVAADRAPQLVTFTKGSTAMGAYSDDDITPIGTGVALGMTSSNTKIATDFTPDHALYWDDFSNSSSDVTDLRTDGHYLESFYGYCYNGGEPSTALVEESGVLGWTVDTDQSTGFKTSDLLWSAEQTPISYIHAKETRKGLLIPFTHAMSKVTISIECNTGKGFSSDVNNFAAASVVLKNMNTVCTLAAPTATVTASGTPDDIIMLPITEDATNIAKSFTALIPQNTFRNGLEFASLNNIDGNNYKLVLSDAMMDTESAKDWASKLTGYGAETGGTTQPGVHYMITVTIAKQEITVKASIQNWEDVTAQGVGEIQFVGDIIGKGSIAEGLQANGFAIYKAGISSPISYSQASVWSYAASNWTASPKLYWPNGGDKFYFRALSGYNTEDGKDLTMSQGRDVLWATTPAHSGPEAENPKWNYAEGAPIAPRTGDVPLAFEHAMSKITVKLATTTGADAVAVDLAGAKISIANIYDGGTIDLSNGSIGTLTASTDIPVRDFLAANDATDGTKLSEVVVVPQSLIALEDGTTRDGSVSFYNAGELTEVGGVKYDTSTLEKVYYTADEANTHNATLDGHKTTSDVKIPAVLYTEETAAAYNATLDGAVESGDPIFYTYDEFKALTNTQMTDVLFALLTEEQKKHVCTSVAEYNELKGLEITEGEFNALSEEERTVICTLEQYKALAERHPFSEYTEEQFNDLTNDQKKKGEYTEETAKTHNADLTGAVSAGQVQTEAVCYTQDEANAYNATLPEAIHEGDFKEYRVTDGSREANPGDIKTKEENPKIKMLITLADGSTYSLDLATCTDSNGDEVIQWERGKHYTYTISLSKEEITFRAMIKDWIETSGGGNANLEWD